MSCQQYLKESFGKDGAKEFLIWAFGEDGPLMVVPSADCVLQWNKRHGNKLMLNTDGTGKVNVDLPKMANLYVDEVLVKLKGLS